MKKMFLTLLLILGSTIQAMQTAPADTITLVASDGKEFTVPVSFAQEAETVKLLMGGVSQESASKKVEFKNIGSNLLRYVEAIANAVEKHKKLKNKALLDAIEKEVGSFPSVSLLKVFDFLGYDLGKQFAARAIARSDAKTAYFLKQKLLEDYGPLVAKYYYLLNKKTLSEVDPKSYGFSIQDYLDYRPDIISERIRPTSANLSSIRINNLYGINRLPNFGQWGTLFLDRNQIREIPTGIWQGFDQLKILYLDGNQISEIPVNAWKGLVRLKEMYLHNNQISEIDKNAWQGMTQLQQLIIKGNPISDNDKQIMRDALPNVRIGF